MTPSCYGLYISSCYGRVEVLDRNKSAVLYRAEVQLSKPQLYIYRPLTEMFCDEIVALATFRRFSSAINIQIYDGEHLDMRRKNLLSSTHTLRVEGRRWSWRRDGILKGNLRLINVTSNRTIATFHKKTSWSGKMLGIFTVFGTHQSPVLDAVIVTGLAKLGYQWLAQSMASGT
ncbi:hypothetical protein X797_011137 [Metarhizium robertsii]|uniref:Uncharacterized protein n=2 Tax=Metarhizium robertsii TaxID=568076 RepID=E9EKT8_METRA|nr:uncharacterized protein MAA_00947 [Metarhizium robertsii ARSEF 23]EFZ03873.1 hypothetical protein MAA_00947 [Metarhizium robertsii ARSEF 23]EXU95786.1 hypothetical protein X797_011137 [Metarhizium robertsii]